MRRLAAVAGVVAMLAFGVCLRGVVTPAMAAPVVLTAENQERLEQSVSASVFGELRGGVADYLWLKVERLLHNGVELRGLTPGEKRDERRHRASQAAGEKEWRHEADETTVVPNREADHRGIMGELERQIKPYADMRHHHHRDSSETAALFRLMTWANPHFLPGWVVGADVLATSMRRPADAIRFLEEGAMQNPDSLEIQTELGRYLLTRFKNGAAAEQRFRRAIELGVARKILSDDEKDSWENAHRWLVLEYYRSGRPDAALSLARLGMRRFPSTATYFHKVIQRWDRWSRCHSKGRAPAAAS